MVPLDYDMATGQITGLLAVVTTLIAGVAAGREESERKRAWEDWEARVAEDKAERARLAFIEPKDSWTIDEVSAYNGDESTGPILIAVDGLVFNVGANGRQFYAAGSEYNVFAGRDATRLLAKGFLVEETPEEAREPLNVAQRAALAGWLFTLKSKYEIVGQLEGSSSSLAEDT